jgi:hypothetical protein
MKYVLFTFLLFAVVLQGCKKDNEIDPRDQFVGIWNVSQTISISELGLLDNYTTTYSIKKDSRTKNGIIIYDEARNILATVDGNTFSCKYSFGLWDGTNSGTQEIASQGVIRDKIIYETGTAQVNMYDKSSKGTWSAICNLQ